MPVVGEIEGEEPSLAEIFHLNVPRALIGVWRSDEDDTRSEYRIQMENGQLSVSAKDYLDGEKYVISNISCDQKQVEFDTFMPSTSRKGRITITASGAPDRADVRFTFTDVGFMTRCHED